MQTKELETDKELFYTKISGNDGILSQIILNSKKLHFFRTSFSELNDTEILSKKVIDSILKENSLLFLGNEVKNSSLSKLIEFENFIYEKYVGKKIVLLYGNCHTGAVKRYLETSKEFNTDYAIYPIKEIQEVKNADYFDLPVFQVCDVFIHQCIQKKNRYGERFASENVISKLNSTCKVIAMPNVYHLPCCLFPQYYDATELRYNNRTYFFRDKIIDDGLKQGKTLTDIARHYYDYKFDNELITENFYKFLDKVRKREQEWDIKVADFIETNIRAHSLFYEMNHPTNYLIKFFAKGILSILYGCNYTIGDVKDYKMDTYQMPMLTAVQSALQLDYSSFEEELRTTGVKLRSIPMDINEYIREYYAALWICGEFDAKTSKKSKILFRLYRLENIYLKVIGKICSKAIKLGKGITR